jgi:hypothetical protein
MSEKQFFYGIKGRTGAAYYGVIAWDTKRGGDHRRLWESQVFIDPNDARDAVNRELKSGTYPEVGIMTFVVEQALTTQNPNPVDNAADDEFWNKFFEMEYL